MKNQKLNTVFLDFDDIKNQLLGAGQAQATLEVGSRLAKKDHKIIVICSKYPGYKDRIQNGIEYKHIGVGTRNIKINNAIFILAAPLSVRKIKNADVIIECFTAPISTLFSPLFTKIPVIVLPSMFDARRFSDKYHLPFYLVEELGIRFYKYFLPYSNVDSAKIKRLNPDSILKIVPQGVTKEYFEIKHKKPEHILFLGRFDISQKGIDLLVEAFAKVSDEIKYPLVIAGHGPDEKKIFETIKQHKLEDKVKIVGSAYGDKKIDLISKALFVVFPSRQDELSLWMLEALASGLPIVAFDLPELEWTDKSTVLKAKRFDTEEYAKLMISLTNKNNNREMRKNARKLARKYTWEKVVSDYESFIKEVLDRESK